MIVRKFASDTAKSKQKYITDIVTNITTHKCSCASTVQHVGARGFITDRWATQLYEMIAVALDAPRSEQPVAHWMLSWQPGEAPSSEQVEDAVSVLLEELELSDHQAIYALRTKDQHYYLLLAVNRAHAVTGSVVKPNGGFDIEAGHKAIAKIAHQQGWAAETHARYAVNTETQGIVRI
jgi:hypothetical protein